MAFLFTHEWIANLVLKKFKKKKWISNYNNIDDYFFGAIAPDIRYITNSDRSLTHLVNNNDSILDEFKNKKNYSKAFLAGYETHLITDDAWSNQKNWIKESIYEFYKINPDDLKQKFTLYFLVDDYFQGEANWLFPLNCSANIIRANETNFLIDLGFTQNNIQLYKSLASIYLREPGIDTFNLLSFIPNNLDEILMRKIIEDKTTLTSFLKEFKKTSIEKNLESFEKHL